MAIHPKAMPVILRTPAAVNYWLTADMDDALYLQKPLLDGTLRIVSRAMKFDPPTAEPRHKTPKMQPKTQLDLF